MSDFTNDQTTYIQGNAFLRALQLICAILWAVNIFTDFRNFSYNLELYQIAQNLCFINFVMVGAIFRLKQNEKLSRFWNFVLWLHIIGLVITIIIFCAIIYRGSV